MTKERPTHLCRLEIDPRDPIATTQTQADRIAELEFLLIKIRDQIIADDSPEAYHLLYMFAESMAKDPYKPWIELEEAARAHDKDANPLEENLKTQGAGLSVGLGEAQPGKEPESMAAQHDRYRMALAGINARLSITEVPQDDWVKTLHGEIFALAAYALKER